jgi:hypothetical protein
MSEHTNGPAVLDRDHAHMSDGDRLQTIQIRLTKSLIARIDHYRLSTMLRPSRSQMIRLLAEQAMTAMEQRDPH